MVRRGIGLKEPSQALTSRFIERGITFSKLFLKYPQETISVNLRLKTIDAISFSHIEVVFNNQLIQLADEVEVLDSLKREIVKTSVDDANAEGHIVLALGIEPEDLANAPTGTIDIARLSFVPVTTSLNQNTQLEIYPNPNNWSDIRGQVVDLKGNDISYLFGAYDETVNIVLNSDIDHSTLRPCIFENSFGSQGDQPGQFNSPASIAAGSFADSDYSYVYVSDTQNHRIQAFDYLGNFLYETGSYGSGEEQFDTPGGISVNMVLGASHFVYVADTNNNRVQVYSHFYNPDRLNHVTNVGGLGNNIGEFDHPEDVASENFTGYWVYVADTGNDRVQRFGLAAVDLIDWEAFGGSGTGDGEFIAPNSVAVDSRNGDFYVADSTNRIQKFTDNGAFIYSFGTSGTGEREFVGPLDISVDASGDIYVIDTGRNKIIRFTSNGDFLNEWGTIGSGDSEFSTPMGIAADWGSFSFGKMFVADTQNHRIQKFSCLKSECTFERAFGEDGTSDGQFKYAYGTAVDKDGYVYVTDYDGNTFARVQKFDADGNYMLSWGSYGSEGGQLKAPHAVDIDSGGNVYIADSGNHRVQKFDNSGNFISAIQMDYAYPYGITIDSLDNLYVSDYPSRRMRKYNSGGNLILEWGSEGIFDGEFGDRIQGVDVTSDGFLYVSDNSSEGGFSRIQQFDLDGDFVNWFGYSGKPQDYNGYLRQVVDVAIDSFGSVYIVDSDACRVTEFNKDGIFKSVIGKWYGDCGSGDGEFSNPSAMAFHPTQNLMYVVDTNNHRVQKFVCPEPQNPTPTSTDTPTPTPVVIETLEVRVNAGSDDAEEHENGTMESLTSSDLELVRESDDQLVGMRFNSVDIPQGATIQSAYIQFSVDETTSETTNLTIHGEDSDSPNTFSSSDNNISNRTKTSSSVSWNPSSWTTRWDDGGPDQQTSDIRSVVQEIVDRPGWSSGNSLVIMISGTGKRVAESYNGYPSKAPLLHIEYGGSTPQPTSIPTPTTYLTSTPTPTWSITSTPVPTIVIPTSTPKPSPTPPPILDCSSCFKGKCDGTCHPNKDNKTTCPDCLPSNLYQEGERVVPMSPFEILVYWVK
ncbi:6-bladed beta-propeller, partial [Patescibacteria group bacterium]